VHAGIGIFFVFIVIATHGHAFMFDNVMGRHVHARHVLLRAGWALPPEGCCWPQATLASTKKEIRKTIRFRILNLPTYSVCINPVAAQCFCKRSEVTRITEVIIAGSNLKLE